MITVENQMRLDQPVMWMKTNDFRWYYTKMVEMNTPQPKLQVAWCSSTGLIRWEDVPVEFEK